MLCALIPMPRSQVGADAERAHAAATQVVGELGPERRDQPVEPRVEVHAVTARHGAQAGVDRLQRGELEGVFVGLARPRTRATGQRRERQRHGAGERRADRPPGHRPPAGASREPACSARQQRVRSAQHDCRPQRHQPHEHAHGGGRPQRVAERFGEHALGRSGARDGEHGRAQHQRGGRPRGHVGPAAADRQRDRDEQPRQYQGGRQVGRGARRVTHVALAHERIAGSHEPPRPHAHRAHDGMHAHARAERGLAFGRGLQHVAQVPFVGRLVD